jgi:hypothetical protein
MSSTNIYLSTQMEVQCFQPFPSADICWCFVLCFTGWEGLQPRFILQADCEIRGRTHDPLGIYCFICSAYFASFHFPTFCYCLHGAFCVFNSRVYETWLYKSEIVPIYLLGAGCYQSEGFCHHLLYLIWKGCKVEIEEYCLYMIAV